MIVVTFACRMWKYCCESAKKKKKEKKKKNPKVKIRFTMKQEVMSDAWRNPRFFRFVVVFPSYYSSSKEEGGKSVFCFDSSDFECAFFHLFWRFLTACCEFGGNQTRSDGSGVFWMLIPPSKPNPKKKNEEKKKTS